MAPAYSGFHRVDELPERFHAVYPKFKLFNPVNLHSGSLSVTSTPDGLPPAICSRFECAGSKRMFPSQLLQRPQHGTAFPPVVTVPPTSSSSAFHVCPSAGDRCPNWIGEDGCVGTCHAAVVHETHAPRRYGGSSYVRKTACCCKGPNPVLPQDLVS